MNSKIKIEACVYMTFLGYHSPAEGSFSTEAMAIIEEVLKTRPTVANLSVQYQAGVLHNIVKVKSSASSVIGNSQYLNHDFRILAYRKKRPRGGKPTLRLRFRDDNSFIMVRSLQEITTGQ